MKEIHCEDVKGKDENIYRIRIFEVDKKLVSALNLITIINGKEEEDNIESKDYSIDSVLLEILDRVRLLALSANFKSY